MTHWIDDAPYPWHLAIARDLHRLLANTFYDPLEIRMLIQSAGAPTWTMIAFDGGTSRIWAAALERAATEGALRTLLAYILVQAIPKSLGALVHDLLAAQDPPASALPGNGAQPVVDAPSREEALLFGDDLSESVGEIADLIAAIERVMQRRSAVCRLEVTGADGTKQRGTGTLLTGGRVLTNHHVLVPGGVKAAAVSVEFNLEQDALGQMTASTIVAGDVAAIRSDAADDWGVISVAGVPNAITPIDLATSVAAGTPNARAFILQHPGGNAKRLAFVRNRISTVEARRVFYITDTQPGSSGAPVFDVQGQIIALHRAGGTPIKYAGAAVAVKRNEGVRMDVIAPAILSL